VSPKSKIPWNKKYFSEEERRQAHNETVRRWRKNNPIKTKQQSKKGYDKNRIKRIQNTKEWNAKNKERHYTNHKLWVKSNRPKVNKIQRNWHANVRKKALSIIGNGKLECVRCGCNILSFLEINHKNGGGTTETRKLGSHLVHNIVKGSRKIEDLELLCKPCNAIHALELKHSNVPLKVIFN